MSIEIKNKIDLIGIDKKTNKVVLTISDHLDWYDESYHLNLLQDKINTYLRFIESGEIFAAYPNAKSKKIVIEIVHKYDLSKNSSSFIQKASEVLKNECIELKTTKF